MPAYAPDSGFLTYQRKQPKAFVASMSHPRGSLFWPKRVCASEQDKIFRVLSLKQGTQFNFLKSRTGRIIFGPKAFKRV